MDIPQILLKAGQILNEEIKTSFVTQGHHLTGAWEESIHTNIEGEQAIGTAAFYGSIVNAGVSPDRIPYGDGKGTGAKTSLYIQGLYNYFIGRGFDSKTALSYAFATAKKQKKEGMSTIASRSHSSTGERQKFMERLDFTKTNEIVDSEVLGMVLNNSEFGKDILVNL